MDELEFQRVLNLFPVVRPRDFVYADTTSSSQSVAQPAPNENWKDALDVDDKESTHQKTDQHEAFWIKLQTAAEKKVGAAEAERFQNGFRKIYNKLVNEGLSLDAAKNLLNSSNNYGK